MKILLTSDWQLGAGTDLGQGDHGPGSRFQDQVDVLNRIVDIALAEQCGLIANLGDTFERARPAPHEILAVQNFVRNANDAMIRCLFLQGNHDSRGTALPTALEIFAGNGCVVSLLPSILAIEDVVFATLPWVPPGHIVAAMPGVDRADVNDAAAQALVAGAQALKLRCDIEYPDLTPVLIGHWAVSGGTLPTGLPTAQLREPVIPLEGLTVSGFNLAMFGHIHVAGMLAAGPTPVGYCGTPCAMNWAEADQPHGVWIFDSAENTLRFVAVEDNRRFVTIDLNFGTAQGVPFGWSHEPTNLRGAVVRARYEVSESDARRVNQSEIRAVLTSEGAEKVVLRPKIIREERARVATMSEDLTETAALDLWVDAAGIEPQLAARMHAEHTRFLAEVRA